MQFILTPKERAVLKSFTLCTPPSFAKMQVSGLDQFLAIRNDLMRVGLLEVDLGCVYCSDEGLRVLDDRHSRTLLKKREQHRADGDDVLAAERTTL